MENYLHPIIVGKDVAKALGYAKALNAIFKYVDIDVKKDAPIQGTLGGSQQMTIINESGLYSLIFEGRLQFRSEKRCVAEMENSFKGEHNVRPLILN